MGSVWKLWCGAGQHHPGTWAPASNCRLADDPSKSACSPYPSFSPPQNSWNKPRVHQTPFSPHKSIKLQFVMKGEAKRRAQPYVPSLPCTKKIRWDDGRQRLSLPESLTAPQGRNSEQAAPLDPSRQLIVGLFMSWILHFLLFLPFLLP